MGRRQFSFARVFAVLVLGVAITGLTLDALFAADADVAAQFAGVVRIANREAGGASLGTGTFVAVHPKYSLIITCAHLFSDGAGELFIIHPDRRNAARPALLVAQDDANDLACLIAATSGEKAVPLARRLPALGSKLTSGGFGQEGVFRANRGEHLCYVTLRGGESEGVLELAGFARQGDSGGPILNDQGELVGVIMGTDGATVDGTHCRRIRTFLDEHPITPELIAQVEQLDERALDVPFVASFDGSTVAEGVKLVVKRLTGRVRFDNRAVQDVQIKLSGLDERVETADANGRFVFEGLRTGAYRLEVETVLKNKVRAASQSVYVSQASAEQSVEIELE